MVYIEESRKSLRNKLYDLFQKLGFSLAVFVVTFIPTWIFLIAKHYANPEGFWQNMVLLGFGVWIGGGIQILLIIVFIVALNAIWSKL
jgi:hypothetical protein